MPILLLAITATGMAARLVSVHHAARPLADNIPQHLNGDEVAYEQIAYDLYCGRFFESPGRVPVYPAFLAACYAVLGGRRPDQALFIQAIVSALVIPLTYLLARRFLRPWAALLAAGLVAFNTYLIDQAEVLYTEAVYTPLLLLAVLALLWARGRPSWPRFAVAGALMAAVTLTRPTAALLAVLVPIVLPWAWTWRARSRASLAYGAAMVLLIAPWTLHNWRQFHHFLPLCTSNAALWHGCPEFYHLNEQGMKLMPIWDKYLIPGKASSIDGDAAFTRRAIESIKAEPWVYAKYSVRKPADFWLGNPYAEWPYGYMFKWQELRDAYAPWTSPLHTAGLMVWRQLPLVALLALIILPARRRLAPFWPLLFLCLYFTAVHTITYAETRYSNPLHPLLIVLVLAAFTPAPRARPSCAAAPAMPPAPRSAP